jgi:hypothetical protein
MLGMVVSKYKNNNSSQFDINLPYWAKGITTYV